jgi:DNA ligase-1|tara:strand:- start:1757 stop:3073 length:1317 start_codon:yes stop_codon:yes gene_type:complete
MELQNFNYLQSFLTEMNQSSSGNHKIAILKKYADNSDENDDREFLQKIFYYTYNPYKKYGVTSKNCKKNSDLLGHSNTYGSIFTLLDDLANRVCTGHTAIANVNRFILENKQYEDIIYNIIDRDLKMGASTSSINKVIPELIPTFKVALANPYNVKRVDFQSGDWYGSRKLDGVRCICRKEMNTVTFFSRSGKEFLTLDNLANEISKIGGDFILDGEICMVDKDGNEDFQGIMKQIRKKNHQIENPKFFVFDQLTLEEFDNKTGVRPLTQRIFHGIATLPKNINSDMLAFLPQEQLTTEEQFTEMAKEAEEAGFEGIMVRKNIGYEGKRSHNLLKVKKFHDAEYTVLETVNGNIRWTENGKQIERECLSSIIIEHKGCRVSVGSGFSKEQREMYYESPQDIIGKTVTVQYFEETENQQGGSSLRFPVLKHIYTNGRDC